MVEASIFENFARSDALRAKLYTGDNTLALESLAVARAYAEHVSGLRNGRGDTLKVACGFLTDYGFNGVAGLEAGHHCCALDLNLIGATLDLAMTTMSIAELMPDIGEPKKEETERVRVRDWPMGYAYADAPELDGRTPSERLTNPLDVTRRRCAVYLQLVTLDLLWRHEIAHALMGHLMFARDSLNLKVLHERPVGGQSFDVLPMEVEADKHALLSCLDTASQSSAPFQPKGLDLTRDQRFRCTLVAASLVCWFWAYLEGADRREDPGYDPGESHPPPGLRIMQLLTGVWEYFVRLTKDAQRLQHIMDGLHDDLQALARAHDRFRILDPSVLYAPDRTDAAAAAHKIVADRRDAQAKELESYRFFETAGADTESG